MENYPDTDLGDFHYETFYGSIKNTSNSSFSCQKTPRVQKISRFEELENSNFFNPWSTKAKIETKIKFVCCLAMRAIDSRIGKLPEGSFL